MTPQRFLALLSILGLLLVSCGSSDGDENDQLVDAADETATMAAAAIETLTAEVPTATAVRLPTNARPIPSPIPIEEPTETPPLPGEVEIKLNIDVDGGPPILVILQDLNTDRYYHTINQTDQFDVTFSAVEPGTYVAYAYSIDNDQIGGYTACDVSTPDCSDHTLIPFEVTSGGTVSDIAIGDWTAPSGSFPDPPSGLMPTAPPPAITPTEPPSATPTETETPAPKVSPSATATTNTATGSATVTATPTATAPPPTETTPSGGVSSHTYSAPVIIANYVSWYNPDSWNYCTSDTPASGPYQSGDPATISRHIAEARAAGLDGFSVHWGGPGDITDSNLKQILGQGYGATITFLNHYFYGVISRGQVVSSLQTVMGYTSSYGTWIRYGGKPVILFEGMNRIDTSGGLTAVQAWAEIRDAVDPNHTAIWMAEGLDPAYMEVFDGLYIYRIDHACCPNAYQNAGKWAGWVRDYESLYGPRYWMATIQPGWDDSRTIDEVCNGVRLSAEPFARDREGGAYYDRTFAAAMASYPDMILLNSFNEWVEGSMIEPSATFGSFYLEKTAAFAAQFKTR